MRACASVRVRASMCKCASVGMQVCVYVCKCVCVQVWECEGVRARGGHECPGGGPGEALSETEEGRRMRVGARVHERRSKQKVQLAMYTRCFFAPTGALLLAKSLFKYSVFYCVINLCNLLILHYVIQVSVHFKIGEDLSLLLAGGALLRGLLALLLAIVAA